MLDPVAQLEAEVEEETAAAESEPAPCAFTIDTLPDEVAVTLLMGGCRDAQGRVPKVTITFRPLYSDALSDLFEAIEVALASLEGAKRAKVRRAKLLDAFMHVVERVEGYGADVDALRGSALRPFFAGQIVPKGASPARVGAFRQALEMQVETALVSYKRAQEPVGFFR